MKETPAPQPESTERSREQLATEEDGRALGGPELDVYFLQILGVSEIRVMQ